MKFLAKKVNKNDSISVLQPSRHYPNGKNDEKARKCNLFPEAEPKDKKQKEIERKEKMTCKECVHYEVCAYDNELADDVGLCSFFKPKSRFVELPCEVGKTIYFLYDRASANKPDLTPRIYETKDWYFDIDKKGISILPRSVHGYKGKYHYHLNKTVFLSREEAEKVLKEREANDT